MPQGHWCTAGNLRLKEIIVAQYDVDRPAADPVQGTGDKDMIEVDGEQIPKSLLKDFRNDQNWKARNTQEAERVARERDAVASERAAVAEERRAAAAERTARAEATPAGGKTQDDLDREELLAAAQTDLRGLPSPADDEEGYTRGVQERTSAATVRAAIKAAEIADRKSQARSSEAERRSAATANQTAAISRVVGANEATVRGYFAAHPEIDKSVQDKITEKLHRGPAAFGAEDPTTHYIQFDAAGLDAAHRAADPQHFDSKAKQTGFDEGLAHRQKAGAAGQHVGGGGGNGRAPGSNATAQEVGDYIMSLPDSARQRYMDQVLATDPEMANKLIRAVHQADLEAAGLG